MTNEEPISLGEEWSDYHCVDCGVNTFPGYPASGELAVFLMNRNGYVPMTSDDETEVYIAQKFVWKQAGMKPGGGCHASAV